MKLRHKYFAAFMGFGIVAAPLLVQLTAIAAPTGFTTHKDAKGNIYVGGNPSSEVSVTIGNLEKTRNLKVNACGIATYKGSLTTPLPSTFRVGTTTITIADLPTQLLPKCNTTTGALEEARTSNFKTSDGVVVLVGQTVNSTLPIVYPATLIRKVKLNLCGIGRITNSQTKPYAASVTFKPGMDAAMTNSSIPTKLPFLCTKDGTTYAPLVGGGS